MFFDRRMKNVSQNRIRHERSIRDRAAPLPNYLGTHIDNNHRRSSQLFVRLNRAGVAATAHNVVSLHATGSTDRK